MTTLAPEAAVKARLEEAITGVAALGAPVYLGQVLPPKETATKAVFLVQGVGRRHFRFCGTAEDWREPTIQLRIRSPFYDYAGGLALARACRDRLHAAALEGYVSCLVREPEPVYLRLGPERCHEWSLNVELSLAAAAVI